jgi:hypothetical protein
MGLMAFVIAAMQLLAPNRDVRDVAEQITQKTLEHEPLFKDDESRVKTAALVVAVTFRESSFRNKAKSSTNDHCLGQVHGRPDLADDVEQCLDVVFNLLRASMKACGPANPLGVYATGTCSSLRGRRISIDRMHLARHLVAKVLAP